jgi:hypothetical protein
MCDAHVTWKQSSMRVSHMPRVQFSAPNFQSAVLLKAALSPRPPVPTHTMRSAVVLALVAALPAAEAVRARVRRFGRDLSCEGLSALKRSQPRADPPVLLLGRTPRLASCRTQTRPPRRRCKVRKDEQEGVCEACGCFLSKSLSLRARLCDTPPCLLCQQPLPRRTSWCAAHRASRGRPHAAGVGGPRSSVQLNSDQEPCTRRGRALTPPLGPTRLRALQQRAGGATSLGLSARRSSC